MCGRHSRSRMRLSTPCAIPTASCCRPRATCTRRRRSRSAGRPPCASSRSNKLNEFFDGDADDIGIVMQGGMYNTALRALEMLGPRRRVRREPHPALRAQRHLSADRCRVRPLLRGQEGDPDRRGRPAGIHRAGGQHDPAPRGHPDPDRGQGHAADGGRIYRRRDEGGRAEIRRDLSARPARRSAARRSRRHPPASPRQSRRSPARCTAARRRSAPAVRSGRSSRR